MASHVSGSVLSFSTVDQYWIDRKPVVYGIVYLILSVVQKPLDRILVDDGVY